MVLNDELNRDVDIDLGGIFASIWRNKFKLLLASLITTALAFVLLQSISPRYRSEARVLIRSGESVLSAPSITQNSNQTEIDSQGIASKIELLKSRTIARKVMQALNLTALPEFDSALDRSPLAHILASLGVLEKGNPRAAEDRVLEAYYDKLNISQAEQSRVIVVEFSSKDPKLAAAIPNLVADEYMALQERLKRGAAPEDLEKLQAEVLTLSMSVKLEETAMVDFRRDKDLLQGSNNSSLATQELSELATELGRVRSQLSRAKANAASVKSALNSGSLDTAASVLQSPLIQRLRERQVTFSTQLSDLSIALLPGHPRIQRVRSQIATLDSQIAREARKIERSLQQQARVAQARENDLVKRRSLLKAEAGRVDREQVELQEMERELVAKRQLLSQYTLRLKEAKSRQAREFLPADAFVFSRAEVPAQSYFPKKLPILAGTFFGTFLLGSIFALIASVLSGTAARAQDTNQPTVKNAKANNAQKMSTVTKPKANISAPPLSPEMNNIKGDKKLIKPFKSNIAIAAKTLKSLGKGRIAVLSPEGHGHSDGTVTLARYLADQGATVIILDMTSNGSATKQMLNSTKESGIKDLLTDRCSIAEAIHRDTKSAAHILPSGNTSVAIAPGSGSKIPEILTTLHQAYDFVIVDCGKVGVEGLKRISNAQTMNIISADDHSSAPIKSTYEELQKQGYSVPLIITTTIEESQMMNSIAA